MDDSKYIYPDFSNSLVNVPHSVLAHYGLQHTKPPLVTPLLQQIKNCSKLVFFLIDGFGYNLFKKEAAKYPFFKKIDEGRHHHKITTIFPSTTAAGITTFESGLTPREHGLFKWNLYFDELDLVLQPLPYKVVLSEFHNGTVSLPEETRMLFNGTTLYEYLAEGDISSFYFVPELLKDGVYTKAISKGATIVPYLSITDLFIQLRQLLEMTQGKMLCYIYWGGVDSHEHFFGPWTEYVRAELELLDEWMGRFITKLDVKTRADTALLITADHGQTEIDATEIIYLNKYPQVVNNFQKSRNGIPIPPTGNPRDAFLHIQKGKVDETVNFLKEHFGDIADVFKLEEPLIDRLFGEGKEHPEFRKRLGNVLILPKGKKSLWYQYLGYEAKYHGHHGGLSEDEMYIPFIAARMSALV